MNNEIKAEIYNIEDIELNHKMQFRKLPLTNPRDLGSIYIFRPKQWSKYYWPKEAIKKLERNQIYDVCFDGESIVYGYYNDGWKIARFYTEMFEEWEQVDTIIYEYVKEGLDFVNIMEVLSL